MHRLFVAFGLPEALSDALLDRMEGVPGLRWQSEEQLHLTLRFIGEVERPLAEDVATALGTVRPPPLQVALDGVGQFEARRGGVLWAGVAPKEPLRALAAKVERACQMAGLAPQRRAFHPHITLARWSGRRPALNAWLEQNAGLASPPEALGPMILFESHLSRHGAQYRPIATYPLQA